MIDFPVLSPDVLQKTMKEFHEAWTARHGKCASASKWAEEFEEQWNKVFTYQTGATTIPHKVMWNASSNTATNTAEHLMSFNLLRTIDLIRFCGTPHAPNMSAQWNDRQKFLGDLLAAAFKAHDVDLNRVISPTGRDLWMQLAMTSINEESDLRTGWNTLLDTNSVFKSLTDLGLELTARPDHSGEGLLSYISIYSRVPKQQLLDLLDTHGSEEFWAQAATHPVSSAPSKGYPNRQAVLTLLLKRAVSDQLSDPSKIERHRAKM